MGLVLARVWIGKRPWHFANRKVDAEATDGGSSREERICFIMSFRGGE